MLAYTIRRVLLAIPVMLMVATAVFLLLRLTPGDPAGVILGPEATEERRLALRGELGLEDPLPVQYVRWLGKAARGDLGRSIFLDKPVTVALAERAQPTLLLTILALFVAVAIGLPTGVIAARARGSWLDLGTMGVAMVGIAMPTFWLGLNLIFIFAVLLRWLPVAGYQPLSAGPWEALRYLILPAITLGVAQGALLARMTRSMMLEVLDQDYVRTARAKGLTERAVVVRHALRNALIPVVTLIGIDFGTVIGAANLTETVFNWPGLGSEIANSVIDRDLPVILGLSLVVVVTYAVINLLVDLSYAWFDPRIRLGERDR